MGLPRSFLFFWISALVFVLQMVPGLRIFLLFVGAGFWSIALINLGFAGIVVEAAKGQIWRGWVLLTLAWYGGYAGYAIADHFALLRLQDSVAAQNAKVRIPFDPGKYALVWSVYPHTGGLVKNFSIPVTYMRSKEQNRIYYFSTRLAPQALCAQFQRDQIARAAGIFTFGISDKEFKSDRKLCELRVPENPMLPKIIINEYETSQVIDTIPVTFNFLTLVMPNGKQHLLRSGYAEPLTWFPQPMLSCALDFNEPCRIWFGRMRSAPITAVEEYYGDVVIANALGLHAVTPAERRTIDSKLLLSSVAAAIEHVVDQAVSDVDRILKSDPGAQADVGTFQALRGRMDIILPRLEAMIAYVERAAAGRDDAVRENARQLFNLVEQVPASRLAPYRSRIEAIGIMDRWFTFEPDPLETRHPSNSGMRRQTM